MLPVYTLLFDTVEGEPVEEEPEYDGADLIPYAPKLKSHIHPRDHFCIATSPGKIYVAQYICQRVTCQVPMWQHSFGLLLGGLCGLFRVYTNHDQLSQFINVDEHLLRVPLQDLNKCTGMKQIYVTNAYIWVPMITIIDVSFIAHAENVQNLYIYSLEERE